MRKCSKCKVKKSLDDFHNYKNGKDGKQHYCKDCVNSQVPNKMKKMKETATHKQCRICEKMVDKKIMYVTYCKPCEAKRARETTIEKKYGITMSEYDVLFDSQDGLCGVCSKASKISLCVDHDHKTGVVRGLLCRQCNSAIGQLGDNIEGVASALRYLMKD